MTDFVFKVGDLIRENGYENRYAIITDMPSDDEILRDMRSGMKEFAWVRFKLIVSGKYNMTHITNLRKG